MKRGGLRREFAKCLALGLALMLAAAASVWAEDWEPLFPAAAAKPWSGLAGGLVEVRLEDPLPAQERLSLFVPAAPWQRLPMAELEPDTRRLAALVLDGPAGPVKIEALRHRLAAEVAAADWLLAVLVRGGATVLAAREDQGAAGRVFEALAVQPGNPQEGGRRLLRAAVWRQGRDLLVVRCLAPAEDFPAWAPAFAAATLLMRPHSPQPERLLGDWPELCLAGGVCLRGPGPGRASPAPGGRPGRQAVFDLGHNGVVDGLLTLDLSEDPVLAAAPARARLAILEEWLAEDGLGWAWSWSGLEVHLAGLPGRACLYQGRAMNRGRDAECQALLWSDGRQALILWTVGPGQMANLGAWLRHQRAFRLAVGSLRPAPAPAR